MYVLFLKIVVKTCYRLYQWFDEESRRAIFERFVKMNYNIRGTGLGLSITKSIVEHYGGGIGVESKKGEGSTFYFTLPAGVEYKEYGKF